MPNTSQKLYQFTLNRIIITGFLILIIGAGSGYGINKMQSKNTRAGSPCASAHKARTDFELTMQQELNYEDLDMLVEANDTVTLDTYIWLLTNEYKACYENRLMAAAF